MTNQAQTPRTEKKEEKKQLKKFNFPDAGVTIEAESKSEAKRLLAIKGNPKK